MHFKTTDLFDKQAKKLSKRYKHLKTDLLDFIEAFNAYHEVAISIQKNLYKIRLKNSDKNKGKRSGYRIYYYLKVEECVYLLTIYDKSEIEMIDDTLLEELIEEIDTLSIKMTDKE